MQHENPAKIKYHIHNPVHWKPFLTIPNADDTADEAWKSKLGVFYNFKNLFPPIPERERRRLTDEINSAVNFGVTAARSGANLETKWKLPVYNFHWLL